jgi:hypothetical protein
MDERQRKDAQQVLYRANSGIQQQPPKKRKVLGFISDGITLEDFEKLTLGLALIWTIAIASFKYISKDTVDPNWIALIGYIVAAFVARKAVSYFKNDNYYNRHNYPNYNTPYYSDNQQTSDSTNNNDTPI